MGGEGDTHLRLYHKGHCHWETDLPVSFSVIPCVHSDTTSVLDPVLGTQGELDLSS